MAIQRRAVLRLFVAAGATLALGDRLAAQDAVLHYANERYGFSIDYPARFRPDPPPENGDGLHFTTPDGAEFTVSGILNISDSGATSQSLGAYEASLRQSADYSDVTYRAVSGDTLVLSGYRGDTVFYERHVLSERQQLANSFTMTYPVTRRQVYDPLVARMSQSFRPGKPEGTWD